MSFVRQNWVQVPWLMLSKEDIGIEMRQAVEEGRDISSLRNEFQEVMALDLSEETAQNRAESLLDRVQELPFRGNYPYVEPSDLEGIKASRGLSAPFRLREMDVSSLEDRILGGWLGRCCGCLLGKPFEGRLSWQIEHFLKSQNRWPLARYASNHASAQVAKETGLNFSNALLYEEGINGMVEDDDINYTVAGLALLKEKGDAFSPADVAKFWLSNLPILRVCTAERAAYRNLIEGFPPPQSAIRRNPYREWIGAQIRGDIYGYVNPANPDRAAEFAWRDACVTHTRNGIYGAMWVAAMLASAFVMDDPEAIVRSALSRIPQNSRLFNSVDQILALHHGGATVEEALNSVKKQWREDDPHCWCHTLSNAMIVAIALLWGKCDFETTICRAVMTGFDTDCNGATTGSVIGVMLGASKLPSKWTNPLQNKVRTGVCAYQEVMISALAEETVKTVLSLKASAS